MSKSHDKKHLDLQTRAKELHDTKIKLEQEKAFLQVTIDSLPYPFYVIDTRNYSILLANKIANDMYAGKCIIDNKCYRLTHHQESPCHDINHPCPMDIVRETGKPFICEHVHYDKDNNAHIMEVHGCPVQGEQTGSLMIEFSIDITERKNFEAEKQQLENHRRQAQKMESMGLLAGGIAHDFNNILTAILGFADIAHRKAEPKSSIYSNLGKVLTAGNRAKELVRQILAFTRQEDVETKPVKIQSTIKESIKFLRATIPTTIKIKQDIDPQCSAIAADPTQIHQILMNLCTNAVHAMQGQINSELNIALQEVILTPSDIILQPDLTPGSYIWLTISDTGCGIDKNLCEKIFDPYFTTKEPGKGTGLGLAVVHGIIKSYHGSITVSSTPGKGTTFTIYLPCITAKTAVKETHLSAITGGTEHILFVDDEKMIAELGKEILTELGYQVTALTSSIEALEHFKINPDKFDLVITDMTMPDMNGKELSEHIFNIRKNTPIILCSGYGTPITPADKKITGICKYMAKPVTNKVMATTIREVLDNSGFSPVQ